jgi:hypothetical protein
MLATRQAAANGTSAGTDLLRWALRYRKCGWNVLPALGKKPHPVVGKWKRYQTRRPDVDLLKRWFRRADVTGILVIHGPVSRDLVIRDFDDAVAYLKWKRSHPRSARALPAVKTRRGFHVYLKSAEGFIGKDKLGDGEFRGDRGHYTVVPPSRHPDGGRYEWVEEFDGLVPWVEDPAGKGLTHGILPSNAVNGEEEQPHTVSPRGRGRHRTQQGADAVHSKGGLGVHSKGPYTAPHTAMACVRQHLLCADDLPVRDRGRLRDLMDRTRPTVPGVRNELVFVLARGLKAIPSLAGLPAEALEPLVKDWHAAALGVIRTKDYQTTWADFCYCWPKVEQPLGTGPVDDVYLASLGMKAPAWLTDRYGEGSALTRLAMLCRELQRAKAEWSERHKCHVFFLACRVAGALLRVGFTTAADHLRTLCSDGILELKERGTSLTHRASDYVWVGCPKGSETRRDGR